MQCLRRPSIEYSQDYLSEVSQIFVSCSSDEDIDNGDSLSFSRNRSLVTEFSLDLPSQQSIDYNPCDSPKNCDTKESRNSAVIDSTPISDFRRDRNLLVSSSLLRRKSEFISSLPPLSEIIDSIYSRMNLFIELYPSHKEEASTCLQTPKRPKRKLGLCDVSPSYLSSISEEKRLRLPSISL
ncbi:hypothetical protein WA171_004466 [Blastocystis sp. BT1]